jgi:hypothetical protein
MLEEVLWRKLKQARGLGVVGVRWVLNRVVKKELWK